MMSRAEIESAWNAALGGEMSSGSLVRFVLMLLGMIGFGIYLSWNGWRAWLTKQILVRGKFSGDYVAYAAGPHAEIFHFEVWLQIGAGLLFALIGAGCSLALLLTSSARRNDVIRAADSVFISGLTRKLKWLGGMLLLAICVAVIATVANGT